MTEPISHETRQSIIRIARRLQNLREKEENRVTIDGAIVETYLRAEREVLLELVHEWQPALGPEGVPEPAETVGIAALAPEAPAPRPSKTRYIRTADIMDYIWSREGSVRMEYMVRDLYHDRKGAEKQATKTLSRMESLADVTLVRDEIGKIAVITARRMPKD